MNRTSLRFLAVVALGLTLAACEKSAPEQPELASADKRAAFLRSFTIKGAGGENNLETAASHGANVIRTWSVKDDGSSKALLDQAHQLGMKVILGVWMPDPSDAEHYRVEGRFQIDYGEKGEEQLARMQKLLATYDDHPALLAWGLGNEVEYSPSYLQTVNAMSELIHQHNPDRITCIVNLHDTDIEMVMEHASDLDLYGANSYGAGAMRSTSARLEEKWGKAYFFSEYAHEGPWEAKASQTGYPMEFSPADKVARLKKTFEVFESEDYPNLVGGVYFLWGNFINGTKTWFSGLLPENPAIWKKENDVGPWHLTPFTDTLHQYWTGDEVVNHAPVVTGLTLNGQNGPGIAVTAGDMARVQVIAQDAEQDPLQYRYWIFRTKGFKRGERVSGPHAGTEQAELTMPKEPGSYTLLVYVSDPHGKASSHQLPFRIE